MIVSPDTFLQLYELLCDRISEVAYPEATEPVQRKLLDDAIVSVKLNGLNIPPRRVNVCQHYLCSPFGYFYNLRTGARKGNDVSIDPMKLVKAIEFVEKTTDDKKYNGFEWESHAAVALERFEKQHSLKKIGLGIKYEEIENLFLHVITSRKEVFESDKIKGLVSRYFEAIRNRQYYEAWSMLSPDIQKMSIWDGNYFLFEAAYSLIATTNNPIWIDKFSYEFGTVICHANFYGMARLFNLKGLFGVIKDENSEESEGIHFYRKLVEARQNFKNSVALMGNGSKFRWPVAVERISKLNTNELSDLLLQQTLLISYLELADEAGANWYRQMIQFEIFDNSEVRIDQFFNHDYRIKCKLFNNQWLIDDIEINNNV